jgi:hypothetical protein
MAENPAQNVVRRLGGIRKAARIVEAPVSTVQGWHDRGVIPSQRIPEVIEKAKRAGIRLKLADFFQEAVA